jgi:hypothetical protein
VVHVPSAAEAVFIAMKTMVKVRDRKSIWLVLPSFFKSFHLLLNFYLSTEAKKKEKKVYSLRGIINAASISKTDITNMSIGAPVLCMPTVLVDVLDAAFTGLLLVFP